MNLPTATAAVMFLGVVLYAVLGGADFGSGAWDLTAGRRDRGSRLRRLVDHAIGPVWEANHVWLIFVLVFFWGGFPTAFAATMRTLAIPFWFAGLGIVLRGAGFAYRKYAMTERSAEVYGVLFAGSSLMTPFFLGAIAGGVASGRVPPQGGDPITSWLNPTSILGGLLAMATTTFLAGVLLTAEADDLGLDDLAKELRRKCLIGGAIAGTLAMAGVPILLTDDVTLAKGLLGRALPFLVISAVSGAATMWLLWTDRFRVARFTAGAAVATVVIGWGFGQYPWMLVDSMTIEEASGARSTQIGLMVAFGIALVIVIPPLLYLFRLADNDQLGDHDEAGHSGAVHSGAGHSGDGQPADGSAKP